MKPYHFNFPQAEHHSTAFILGSGASLEDYPNLSQLIETERSKNTLILGVNNILSTLPAHYFDLVYTHHVLDNLPYLKEQVRKHPYKYILCAYQNFQNPSQPALGDFIDAPCYVLTPSPNLPIVIHPTLLPEHADPSHEHTFTGANSVLGCIGICLKLKIKTAYLLGCDNGTKSYGYTRPNLKGYYTSEQLSDPKIYEQQVGHSQRSAIGLKALQPQLIQPPYNLNLVTLSPYIGSINPLIY